MEHFGCFAQTINLITQDSIKQIGVILETVKRIVSYFWQNPAAMSKFFEQKFTNIHSVKKLKEDVGTRWNSTL